MKTIRISTFEVNSSSTHSYSINTVNPGSKLDVTFIPDENNEIHINIETGAYASNATPQDKSSMLLLYAVETCDQPLFDRIITIIELFTKAKVVPSYRTYDYTSRSHNNISPYSTVKTIKDPEADEDSINESLEDTFGGFCGDLGHGSVSSFKKVMKKICETDASIRTLIFSSAQGYSVESGYDG